MKPLNHSRGAQGAVCPLIAALFLTCWLAGPASGQLTNAGAAPVSEALVIIVNKANPLDNFTSEELRKYFLQERERWPDGRKNTVLMLPPGTAERQAVLRQIYQFTDGEFSRHFLKASFTGQAHSTPKEIASAVNMRKFVFNVPGAIGYVRASEVDDTVKVVRIDGNFPGDADYRLKLASK